jgi:hypothetical protein
VVNHVVRKRKAKRLRGINTRLSQETAGRLTRLPIAVGIQMPENGSLILDNQYAIFKEGPSTINM